MEYIVLAYDSKSDLEHEVNKMIKEGWRPQGGVCFCVEKYESYDNRDGGTSMIALDSYYYQAMVKGE